MMRRLLLGLGSLPLMLLAACGPPPGEDLATADAAPPEGCVTPARTCAEVMATFTADGAAVTVTCDEPAGTFTLASTGLPNYTSNQSTPNAVVAQSWVVTLPLAPACAAGATDVINSRGPIGFMVNGVPFFGPQNANGQDAPTVEAASLDDCDGHASPSCAYHYHDGARCVFGVDMPVADHALPDGHPAVIGYGLDGFALYGPYADPAAAAPLDGCNGHADATRGYHYHATAASPYFIGCLVGEPWQPTAMTEGCGGP